VRDRRSIERRFLKYSTLVCPQFKTLFWLNVEVTSDAQSAPLPAKGGTPMLIDIDRIEALNVYFLTLEKWLDGRQNYNVAACVGPSRVT